MNKTAFRLTLYALPLLSLSSTTNASDLDSARTIEAQTITQSAQSQIRINKSSDKAFELKSEIALLEQEVANLTIYQQHLQAIVADQQQEMRSIDAQLAQISDTRQGVVPLMYQMLTGLEQHIQQDKPIRLEARLARLDELKSLMPQADVSDAEKYRRILEAYQIEMDYGIKLGSYRSQINVGRIIEAEQLYLGRVSLVARSLDRNLYWSWDVDQQRWVSIDTSLASHIDQAFAIAHKQASPSLLELPVSLSPAANTEDPS
ncbi:DUF3450 domain-containing protein [Vibrio hangzhouensis]|uniref:DUF3450 domain-containing protein n=1 Tax=Vibrio hangzhouensis TaxID=462991 RepID=UPI001C95F180|nr:DUF3450 domain-containing protein [Vibrio hangzhouensis]MBY6197137.1 DUF3450 domain-containing protein [Vibrio hangzhouensis]